MTEFLGMLVQFGLDNPWVVAAVVFVIGVTIYGAFKQ